MPPLDSDDNPSFTLDEIPEITTQSVNPPDPQHAPELSTVPPTIQTEINPDGNSDILISILAQWVLVRLQRSMCCCIYLVWGLRHALTLEEADLILAAMVRDLYNHNPSPFDDICSRYEAVLPTGDEQTLRSISDWFENFLVCTVTHAAFLDRVADENATWLRSRPLLRHLLSSVTWRRYSVARNRYFASCLRARTHFHLGLVLGFCVGVLFTGILYCYGITTPINATIEVTILTSTTPAGCCWNQI